MLWHDNRVFIIDVSQSVEMDHPRATEFLRTDCKNVNDFFQKRIEPMTNAELYDFCVNGSPGFRGIEDADIDAALQARLDASALRTEDERKSDDAVFMAAFLPRSLNELSDNCERAQRELNAGGREKGYVDAVNALLGATPEEEDDAAAQSAAAVQGDADAAAVQGDADADRRGAADGDAADGGAADGGAADGGASNAAGDIDDAATASDDSDGDSDDESYDDGPLDPNGRLPNRDGAERAAVKLLKKDAAKAQKLETREARKKKMKKHVKKKATKATKNNK
jgi:RIO kinase 1